MSTSLSSTKSSQTINSRNSSDQAAGLSVVISEFSYRAGDTVTYLFGRPADLRSFSSSDLGASRSAMFRQMYNELKDELLTRMRSIALTSLTPRLRQTLDVIVILVIGEKTIETEVIGTVASSSMQSCVTLAGLQQTTEER